MADPQTLDLVRARRARKLATTPPPRVAPAGLRPTPADAPEPSAPSSAGSFVRGGAQGASFGFMDELVGIEGALLRPIMGRLAGVEPSFQPDAAEAYRESRADYEATLKKDAETNPLAYYGGQIGGGLAVPLGAGGAAATLGGRVLAGAGIGAASGALQGVGDAPTLAEAPGGALKGAAVGGALGAALPAAVAGAKGVRSALPAVRARAADLGDAVVKRAENMDPLMRAGLGMASGGKSEGIVALAKGAQKLRPKAPLPASQSLVPEVTAQAERPDLTAMLDELKGRMTQQVQPSDIIESADDVTQRLPGLDDELARAQAAAEAPTQVRTAPSNWSMTPDKFAGKFGPDDALAQVARGQTPPVPSAPAAARPFEDVTNTVPRLDMGEVEQMLQDVRADLKTPPARRRPPPAAPAADPLARAQTALEPMPAAQPEAPSAREPGPFDDIIARVTREAQQTPPKPPRVLDPPIDEARPLRPSAVAEATREVDAASPDMRKVLEARARTKFPDARDPVTESLEDLGPLYDEFGNELPNPVYREQWRRAGRRMTSAQEGGPESLDELGVDDVQALLDRGRPTKGGLLGTSQYFPKRNQWLRQQAGDADAIPEVRETAADLLKGSRTAEEGAGAQARALDDLAKQPATPAAPLEPQIVEGPRQIGDSPFYENPALLDALQAGAPLGQAIRQHSQRSPGLRKMLDAFKTEMPEYIAAQNAKRAAAAERRAQELEEQITGFLDDNPRPTAAERKWIEKTKAEIASIRATLQPSTGALTPAPSPKKPRAIRKKKDKP